MAKWSTVLDKPFTAATVLPMTWEAGMNHFDRDKRNAEAVFMAVQPWELDVIERGLTCLAALASTHPEWEHVHGQEEPALAVIDKINQVAEYQGYEGGIDGVRLHLLEEGDEAEAGGR